MKAKGLMTEDVVAIGPETPLKDVAAILAERGISGLPVISEQRKVLGVISEADILVKEQGLRTRHGGLVRRLLEGGRADERKLAARTAGQAMSSPAITIGLHGHVSEAARLMIREGIKRLPVVDADGKLVGIVTRSDLIQAFARTDPELEHEIRDDIIRRTMWIERPESVDVRLKRGEVTLSGSVERRYDAELLEDLVARVPGVISVDSTLTWRRDDHDTLTRSPIPKLPLVRPK